MRMNIVGITQFIEINNFS